MVREFSTFTRPLKQICLRVLSTILAKDPTKSLLIFADPRGGSTWLSEILQKEQGTALVWEPLHIGQNELFRKIGFGYRQHIPPEAGWPEAKEAFSKVLCGKNLNIWTAQFTPLSEIINSNRLLVKLCRGNLLLPWIVHNFPLDRKPIYMVRHPFAVVASQMKQGGWKHVLSTFEIPEIPYSHIYKRHERMLQTIDSKEQVLLATWCITNGYLLDHPRNNIDWICITYEDLLMDPETQLSHIYKQWDAKLPEKLLDNLQVRSKTALLSGEISDKENQLKLWNDSFTNRQIDKLIRILDHFEITLYDHSYLPKQNFK